jgi:uncharacterized protein (TIGR03083 family)
VGTVLTSEFIAAVDEHGAALAAAAEQLDERAPVPSCPGWTVDDVLGHVGMIHRWARAIMLAAPGSGRIGYGEIPVDGRSDWYRAGLTELLDTLSSAPDDLAVWAFLPAPNPKAFWARRQAHETAIHRADLEQAREAPWRFAPGFAADGIDELLNGFLARPSTRLRADPPASVLVAPTDADVWWHMTISPDGRATRSDGDPGADATLRGTASDLYLYLWNREPQLPVEFSGQQRVLDLWRELARIT